MSPLTISETQQTKIQELLSSLCKEAELEAAALCDTGGNLLASQGSALSDSFANAAALAAGSFAATRELASLVGENGFESIMHRGSSKGLLIKAVGKEHIAIMILGTNSVEGMARLILKRISSHILSAICESDASEDVSTHDIEIKSVNS